MPLISTKNQAAPIHFEEIHALLVDPFPGMRNALKLTLSNFGLRHIDLAGSALEALHKVQNTRYDLILSDFDLGEGKDGQQLLEELRHRKLISLATAYIMLTAEADNEKVVAAAELAPDDYLIKPFSAERMRNRLEGILRRKQVFSRAYVHYENHELENAVAACDEISRTAPRFLVEALRFKGDLLNGLGRHAEAEALYRKVMEMRALPWARLGLARALHLQKKDAEAETLLQALLDQSHEMMAGYDLLAEVHTARQDMRGTQQALQRGVAMSSKTVRRQQRLGEVAYDNGDLEVARKAYSSVLEKGRYSLFVTVEDYGHLGRILVEQGDVQGALDTLKQNEVLFQNSIKGRFVRAVVKGMAHARTDNTAEAEKAVDEATHLNKLGASTDARFMLDLAATCVATGRQEQADAIIRIVARNAHDSEILLGKVKALYENAGRADAGAQLIKEATNGVRKLNNEAVILAHKGNYAQAMQKLQSACREAPHNPRILMNTVWVMLKHLEQNGADEGVLGQARGLLQDAERLAPEHNRLVSLWSQLRKVEVGHAQGARRR